MGKIVAIAKRYPSSVILISIFVGLNLLDIMLTKSLLAQGYIEVNPIYANSTLLWLKMPLSLGLGLIVARYFSKAALILLCIGTLGFSVWNVMQ